MEKRNYVKPILNSEEFLPNEYIAACGYSGGGTVYGWCFKDVTVKTGLAESNGSPDGYVIPSPLNCTNVSDLFNLSSSSSVADSLKGYSGYGWIDNDGDSKVSGGDQITYSYTVNGTSYTTAATLNTTTGSSDRAMQNGLSDGAAANPKASTLNNITGTKNLS